MITQEDIPPFTKEECKAMIKTIYQVRKENKELRHIILEMNWIKTADTREERCKIARNVCVEQNLKQWEECLLQLDEGRYVIGYWDNEYRCFNRTPGNPNFPGQPDYNNPCDVIRFIRTSDL